MVAQDDQFSCCMSQSQPMTCLHADLTVHSSPYCHLVSCALHFSPDVLHIITPCPTLQVTPFSRWERELPKLVGDARYKAIDKPKERRQIFDDFCRNVAEEQRLSKQRKEQQAAAAEPAFLSLLDEAQALACEAQQPQSPAGLYAACIT